MRVRRMMVICAAALSSVLTLCPKDSKKIWEAPYEKWAGPEALKIFNDSPWAQKQDNNTETGARGGEQETRNSWTVRLLSALPIREAYLRMLQVTNRYNEMPEVRQKQFDAHFNSVVGPAEGEEIVIGVDYQTNMPENRLSMKRFFATANTATLSQSAFLYTPQLGRLDLIKYFPPDQQQMGARFVFARQKEGKPAVEPGDKEMRFEFYPPNAEKLLVGFKVADLMYKGKLAY